MYRHAVVITPVARWVRSLAGRSIPTVSIHPQRQRPSPSVCRVGVHIGRFEACSTFTRVTACRLAESPCDPSVSKAPTVLLPPHELPRSVRCVGQLRGGWFWLECWTTPTISPGPKRRESMPEDLFSQRYPWPQACRAMATASIH